LVKAALSKICFDAQTNNTAKPQPNRGMRKMEKTFLFSEIAHEIHPQIEHLRPKIGNLLVTDPLLARHISPCNQTVASREAILIYLVSGAAGANAPRSWQAKPALDRG
jgi:hypothetical protein